MSKKIAILTQPLHTNYGGLLQAFALQKAVQKIGFETETINYQWKKISNLRKFLSTIKQLIIYRKGNYYFTSGELEVININTKKFIKNNINYSSVFYDVITLKKYFNERCFDAVIVGSDQVWRLEYSPRIESFFLDFLLENKSIKKIAYAASFGMDRWQFSENDTLKIRKLIQQFDYISVRENSAISLCKNFFDLDVDHVLDPTLLLDKDDYLNLIENNKETGNKGKIFCYILDDTTFKQEIVEKISDKLNLGIFTAQPKKKVKENFFINDVDEYIYPSVEAWIQAFRDASFIVTDSFHGTVFSIIFNKPFVAILNKNRGASRFTSLLNLFFLENRLFCEFNDFDENVLFEDIDYGKVNLILKDLKRYSFDKLQCSLLD